MLTGIAYVAQHFERSLARARGTWFNDIYGGSHISELYWRFRKSTWFSELIKTELIRLALIPIRALPDGSHSGRTALAFVNRINHVAVPTFDLDDQRCLSIEIDAELEGVGAWNRILSVYIFTPEELDEAKAKAIWMNENVRRAEDNVRPLLSMLPPEGWRPKDGFPTTV